MLPERKAWTMSEAIALSSPNGSMSKAARKRANERLRCALFGDGLKIEGPAQPSRKDALLAQAKQLRELAIRGMKPIAYMKKAAALEAQAEVL
jgi:spore germination cell wall hydrolase CwlJ-like protein